MISAKIIAHSISQQGKTIITWELEYPRFIHAEFMTHRMFSRNAASSRAIPVSAVIEQVRNNPAMPVHWGQNQSGMQAKQELPSALQRSAKFLWTQAAKSAAFIAEAMDKVGLHKQVANRILEPFQLMKVVMTTTEDANWYWLRKHEDAQPEIHELARIMWEEQLKSVPVMLRPGDWHVPYFNGARGTGCWVQDADSDPLEEALAISSSCCAQVSFRKLDDRLEKAQTVYARLVESEPVHASPFEHQATPMVPSPYDLYDDEDLADCKIEVNLQDDACTWQKGVTHVDRDNHFWSGNFCGFIQHRQLVPNNVCKNYKEFE